MHGFVDATRRWQIMTRWEEGKSDCSQHSATTSVARRFATHCTASRTRYYPETLNPNPLKHSRKASFRSFHVKLRNEISIDRDAFRAPTDDQTVKRTAQTREGTRETAKATSQDHHSMADSPLPALDTHPSTVASGSMPVTPRDGSSEAQEVQDTKVVEATEVVDPEVSIKLQWGSCCFAARGPSAVMVVTSAAPKAVRVCSILARTCKQDFSVITSNQSCLEATKRTDICDPPLSALRPITHSFAAADS